MKPGNILLNSRGGERAAAPTRRPQTRESATRAAAPHPAPLALRGRGQDLRLWPERRARLDKGDVRRLHLRSIAKHEDAPSLPMIENERACPPAPSQPCALPRTGLQVRHLYRHARLHVTGATRWQAVLVCLRHLVAGHHARRMRSGPVPVHGVHQLELLCPTLSNPQRPAAATARQLLTAVSRRGRHPNPRPRARAQPGNGPILLMVRACARAFAASVHLALLVQAARAAAYCRGAAQARVCSHVTSPQPNARGWSACRVLRLSLTISLGWCALCPPQVRRRAASI